MSRKIILFVVLCWWLNLGFSQSNLLWSEIYPANMYSSSYSSSYSIYSPDGKLLKEEVLNDFSPTISTVGMNSGIYLLQMHSKKGKSMIKIIVR